MDSLNPECTPFKKKYEDCFNFWYSEEFLKGKALDNPCVELFREYQVCLQVSCKQSSSHHFFALLFSLLN